MDNTLLEKGTQVQDDDFLQNVTDEEDATTTTSSATTFATALEKVFFSEEEREQTQCDVLHFIADYVEEHAVRIYSSDFHFEIVDAAMDSFGLAFDVEQHEIVQSWFEELVDEYFSFGFCPRRSEPTTATTMTLSNREEAGRQHVLRDIIHDLQNAPQPEQRTRAWYEFRHNVITASSVGKIFASDAQRNSLIYEKCKPLHTVSDSSLTPSSTNFDSPLHWGQKYEPLSVMIYEHKYRTKVGAFGCIQHPTYTFLAASPDGINVDPASPRYGRMLEIKNVVNRDITGIPKDEYWMQVQLQEEVCDLDECDFFETRFREYADLDTFLDALYETGAPAEKPEYMGVMLLFLDSTCLQHRYEYFPIDVSLDGDTVLIWVNAVQDRLRKDGGWRLFRSIYWYLDEMSCVLVQRNRMWFRAALPHLRETWSTIERERLTGYEHRAPKSRSKTAEEPADGVEAARNRAALAQLFAAASVDELVAAIESDASVDDLSNVARA